MCFVIYGWVWRCDCVPTQYSVIDGCTDDPSVYAPAVCSRLRGLITCDSYTSTVTLRSPAELSALQFLQKVCYWLGDSLGAMLVAAPVPKDFKMRR